MAVPLSLLWGVAMDDVKNLKAIINARVFNGDTLLDNHAVLLDDDRIHALIPQSQLSTDTNIEADLQGQYLLPGFIDLQVNGGGGVLFNDSPSVASIRAISAAHRRFGTTGLLPTLITDSFAVMHQAIAAVDEAIKQGVPGILGIHLEGPFLNAERSGVHDADKFCVLDNTGLELLSALQNGKTLVTIAPELTSPEMIQRLVANELIVCAGHSNADYQQTKQALQAGICGFTHLYNAMMPLQSRAPGMVGAALEDDKSWFGIIADGHHIHPAAFKVAVSAKQRGGAILVTDAMPSVGASDKPGSSKSFELNGETITVEGGRCTNAEGVLAGSDLDMMSAINNAADFANLDWFEAVRMASIYPARVLGLDHLFGRIDAGYHANLVAVNDQRQVTTTWIKGESEH